MGQLIEVECPCCHATLWIDCETRSIVQHKKSAKKVHSSFEELLNKEKEKKEKTDERFLQAKELEQAKKKKAEEFFRHSIKDPDKE